MSPAKQMAFWADKLRDITAMGLRFANNIHDRGNYQAVQDIAIGMAALATGQDIAALEPLREPLFSRPTPITVGDGAVIDASGRILLIQRADNGRWAMPGGALEVGETAAQGVVREVWEETGIRCRPTALVGVFDSRLCRTQTPHHLYQFVLLCAPEENHPPQPPTHAEEVLDAGWFAADALPAALDPGHRTRIPEAFRVWRGDGRSFFDH